MAYTLTEVMVAAALMSVLAAVSISGLLFVQRSSVVLQHHGELQTISDLALMQLEIDIQNGVSIEEMHPKEISLKIIRAGDTPIAVRYWIDEDAAALYREEILGEDQSRSRMVMGDLREGRFSFWDRTSETEASEAVRRIAFEALVSRSVAGREVIKKTVSASFLLRNFRHEEDYVNVL